MVIEYNDVKEFKFNQDKNELLKSSRKISFEYVIKKIGNDKQTRLVEHPNKKKYPKQRMFLIKKEKYIYVVPFVEEEDYIFLKTIYPSAKYTRKLLKVKK
ncbi:hypothetical protein B6D29_03725 [Microgenomates bacterium UTCPR1]|nr:MAG: hypothetical protein B6D29_03725 [Microgenomates bacterium UTCPR1]